MKIETSKSNCQGEWVIQYNSFSIIFVSFVGLNLVKIFAEFRSVFLKLDPVSLRVSHLTLCAFFTKFLVLFSTKSEAELPKRSRERSTYKKQNSIFCRDKKNTFGIDSLEHLGEKFCMNWDAKKPQDASYYQEVIFFGFGNPKPKATQWPGVKGRVKYMKLLLTSWDLAMIFWKSLRKHR